MGGAAIQKSNGSLKRLNAKATSKTIYSVVRQKQLDHAAINSHVKPILLSRSKPVIRAAAAASVAKSLGESSFQGLLSLHAAQKSPSICKLVTSYPVPETSKQRNEPGWQRGIAVVSSVQDDPPVKLRPLASGRRRFRHDLMSAWPGIRDFQLVLQNRETTLFAIDTEFEKHGLLRRVVEIGVTTLNTTDIKGVEPGEYVECWLEKAKHYHIVVDTAKSPRARMSHSHFGESKFMTTSGAKAALLDIMQSCTAHDGERHLTLVGHSLSCDLGALLHCPGFHLDLMNSGVENLHIDAQFDTLALGYQARKSGAAIPSFKLGELVRYLGAESRHHLDSFRQGARVSTPTLRGTHNASNDAAYTMMGALLLAANWNKIVNGTATGEKVSKDQKQDKKQDRAGHAINLGPTKQILYSPTTAQRTWLEWLEAVVSIVMRWRTIVLRSR